MKNKFYRHLTFWLATSIQGTLLEYAWIHTVYNNEPPLNIIMQAACFNLVLTPSRLFFTYYALNTVAGKPFKKHVNAWLIFFKLSVALLIAVALHRLGSAYYIIPHEFPQRALYTWQQVFSLPWMFVAVLDIGYVAGIAVALKLFRMQIISLKNEKELMKDKLETELKFLKNQINPHFLFNTLNNIYALARKKSNETADVVVKLASLLRFMLYESAKDSIAISEEIKILDDYVQLEKIRYSKRLEVSFNKQIDDYNQLISPLILLPFVENAFKHGVNDTIDATVIAIDVALNKGRLAFVVENSHNHPDNGRINEHIGLKNVRRQLELTYADFSLNITNLEQTFLVDLKVNLNSNGKL
ncbi:sensor histidine kinase [Mucilaginibacter sp. OK098]|uniref:sensor histidine kinase n=1 Tax=Mucilaginibacter sp. OK098 TaxID=1855297 RepID=UPI00090FF4F5|nr:histidine kinase [Mucilaginibacter sp. OK098]SHN37562.1 Histidine kinase [Mucilaginibacter sp. OK098]